MLPLPGRTSQKHLSHSKYLSGYIGIPLDAAGSVAA